MRDALAQSVTSYKYDALGRLRCVTFGDGSVVDYSYDSAGNRSRVVRADTSTFTTTIPITGTGPVNLRTLAESAGYNGVSNTSITFTLASNVTITGDPNSGIGIDTGDWSMPHCRTSYTATLILQISGKVRGGGGRGASGATPPPANQAGVGGDAIYCRTPMSITVNSGGEVRAGGGGGGGGSGWWNIDLEFASPGGGGGGGFPNGSGGAGGGPAPPQVGQPGVNGTTSGGGAGGAAWDPSTGGAGGAGGGIASTGANGVVNANSPGEGYAFRAASAGAAAGFAIRKNGHTVPVTNNGTISGTVG